MTAETAPRRDGVTGPWDGEASAVELTTGRHLLVAATGGHLAEMRRLRDLWAVSPDSDWVTFDGPQSRELEQDAVVHRVGYVAPRDWRAVLRAARSITRLLREKQYDSVVSTGSAVALSAGLASLRTRTRMVYVESLARMDGPSLTGRLLARVPGIRTRTQVPEWAGGRWRPTTSVLSAFKRSGDDRSVPDTPRLLVTLGTIAPYRFDRLVDAVLATGLAGPGTVWQLGSTTRTDLPGEVHTHLEPSRLRSAMRNTDAVVAHAGVGTLLDVLEAGRLPLVVPRRASMSEHVDDHQRQLAAFVAEAGLGIAVEADDLARIDVLRAASARIVTAA